MAEFQTERDTMLPDGARVRLNRAPEGSALKIGSGLGTVMWVADHLGVGVLEYIVGLDEGAWVWENGSPYVPTDYHVIAPEYLEAA
jgi:hypothetical protein